MRTTLALLALLVACKKDDASDRVALDPAVGEGLFAEGCPQGGAFARTIGVDAMLPGEAAVGTRGDLLLANNHAAYVITDAVGQSTYWYYGGALADGAPMNGCEPGVDKLDDVGLVLAQLDLTAVEQSIIRGFRADTVEVLRDGSDGGPATVRATGTDDTHWLVEHTLINDAVDKGGRPFSGPLGAEITVDYTLDPESPVLQIDLAVRNTGTDRLALVDAALISWGETLRQHAYASQALDLGGFSFDAGMPFVTATDGDGAYAWGIDGATLALVSLSGVNVIVDVTQLTEGFDLAPGESATLTRFFSVGDGGGASSIEPLLARISEPLRDQPATASRVIGEIRDLTGQPVAGTARVEARAPGADWGTIDRVPANADGLFLVVLPEFEDPWEYRVFAEQDGRDPGAPYTLSGTVDEGIELVAEPWGAVDYTLVDGEGEPSPARLVFVRDDGARQDFWLADSGTLPLPPGTWEFTATRGYEFSPHRGQISVPEDGTTTLSATLSRTVDTAGWMSIDTHVHTSDSPDSNVDQAEQLLHAAAHGLEIVLHTEHEHIVDRSTLPVDHGLDAWVNNAIGEEVTSVGIEHMTMFPAVPDGSPRGGFVEWYGMDIDQLFGAMRERSGGGINLINHPSYLDRIGWDRVLAEPSLTDPTLLGLPPTAPLWSWDLDGIEVMNGHGNIWATGNRRFDNWMSMVNAGHRVMAVGCSDDHGGNGTGFPRTYYEAATDLPSELDLDELVNAFRDGRAFASAGAFARVDVDGAGPGGLVTDTDGLVDLYVELEALPEVDLTHFVVFANCDMVDSVLATDPDAVLKHSGVVPLNIVGDTQIVVAAFGTSPLPLGMPQYDATRTPRVLTNPIYIDGDGDGLFSAPGGRECTYDLSIDLAQ